MEAAARARIQKSIDMLEARMKIDSNDLEYETHLRQKRQLEKILTRAIEREAASAGIATES